MLTEPGEHLVGDDLHRLAQSLAQLAGYADGVLAGSRHPLGELLVATLGGRLQGVRAEQRGDRLQFRLQVAFDRDVQADSQVPALAPLGPVREHHHAAVQQQHVARRLVGVEQPAGQLLAGLDRLPPADLNRVQQLARLLRVERRVGVGGPAAVDRDHVLLGVGDRDLERLAGTLDYEHLRGGGVTQSDQHTVVLLSQTLIVATAVSVVDFLAVGEPLGEFRERRAGAEVLAPQVPQALDRGGFPGLVALGPAGAQAVLRLQLAGQHLSQVVRRQVVLMVGYRVVAHRPPSRTARTRSSGSPAVCSFVIMSFSSVAVARTSRSRRVRVGTGTSMRLACSQVETRSR